MARPPRARQTHRPVGSRHSKATNLSSHLRTAAILLLADARDDMERFTALSVARLAFRHREKERSRKFGVRGPYNQVKSEDFFEIILRLSSIRWFKSWLRMDRDAFWHLHDLVKDDPVFVSAGKKPQRPSWLQLAVFLCRMGNESAVKTASFASVSEDDERERFSDAMSEWGFPGCLGSGDGTYIRLEKRPSQNGYAYWCRKKMYALTIVAASRRMTLGGQVPCKIVVYSSHRTYGATRLSTSGVMSTYLLTKAIHSPNIPFDPSTIMI
ncbi:hypothetical protein BD310DRAFT_48728 [Dichomitus squalens]|uniref:DDE Tnp4 domain-containing protein n=1 Tax=Dichomitus squalens TaxID=114155 RepID=A0A4Q9Q4X6_9APHY|nr:hypothetical protein BD310DRAFT_48728 [Dichomitus squalens]